MSIEAMAIALHHSKTQGTTKLVLLGIANHDGDGGAYPSIATLSRYAGGVNRRTVQRSIQELIEAGEISCVVNGGGYGGDARPNLYRVTLRCPRNCDGSTAHRRVEEGGGLHVTPGGGVDVAGGAVYTSPKPSLEPSLRTNTPSNTFEAEFEEFWKIYPRRVEKIAARKAFDKQFAIYGQVILDGAHRLATDPWLPPKQFIPYPASWLNAGGWESEPYPERELTAEEKAAKAKIKAEADRVRAIEEGKRRLAEAEEARANATPPPQCEHGNTIVSCRICINVRRSK